MLISLFVSFTLDPMLSSVWYDPQAAWHRPLRPHRSTRAQDGAPARSIAPCWAGRCAGRKTTLLIALLSFVGSFALPKYIGFEFVPQADLGEQVVSIETPVGSSLEYTEAKLRQVDAAVREFPEVDYTYGTVNTGYANGKNQASLYLRLKPREGAQALARTARPADPRPAGQHPRHPGVDQHSGRPGRRRAEAAPALAAGARHGRARPHLAGGDAPRRARSPAWSTSTATSRPPSRCCRCACARDAASDLGLGSALVAQSLRPLFAGDETSLWRAPDGENYTVMVRLPIDDRTGVADLQRIWFTAGTEAQRPAAHGPASRQIADVVNDVGASQINRRDLNREVQITANVSGRSSGEVSSDLQKILADTKLPPGYRFVLRRLDQGHGRKRRLCRPGARCWR